MAQQRRTSTGKNRLGNTTVRKRESDYASIEARGEDLVKKGKLIFVDGEYKKECRFGIRGNKFGIKHEGDNPLPIREFDIQGEFLQDRCNECERGKDGKGWRQARSAACKANVEHLTPHEIRHLHYPEYVRKCNKCSKRWWLEKEDFVNDSDCKECIHIVGEFTPVKSCSWCRYFFPIDDFPISRTMESGMFNQCTDCSKSYSEAVGNRWYTLNPDGKNTVRKNKNSQCVYCSSKKGLDKDHIVPLSKGGTDHNENIQTLCGAAGNACNNIKSNSISERDFKSIHEISKKQICERYHNILDVAKLENWSLRKFSLKIEIAVNDFYLSKALMRDEELYNFFKSEAEKWNVNRKPLYGVKKFRAFCKKRNIG